MRPEIVGLDVRDTDLLVTDVMLPDGDGRTLARQLQNEREDLKVLLISGYSGDVLGDRAAADVELFHKPFTSSVLLERVAQLIASGRS